MSDLPTAGDYLPNWATYRFVVLDKTERWASAISLEFNDRTTGGLIVFENCTSGRDAADLIELRNTVGAILFLQGLERDCCGLLGRFRRLSQPVSTLLVAEEQHRPLIPVLLEAGANAVLFDIRSDVPLADWCVQVTRSMSALTGTNH